MEPAATAGELEGWGISREEAEEWNTEKVWRANRVSVLVFVRILTQWRMGPAGAVGLDYNVLPFVLEVMDVPRRAWRQVLEDVGVMEAAALRSRPSRS